MAEKMRIGEFFLSIGAMSLDQVLDVLAEQQRGNTQRFGSIALDKGYVDEAAVSQYLLEAYPAESESESESESGARELGPDLASATSGGTPGC